MRGILLRVLAVVFVSVGTLLALHQDAAAQPATETFTINVRTADGGNLPNTLVVCGYNSLGGQACTSPRAFGTGSSGTTTLAVPRGQGFPFYSFYTVGQEPYREGFDFAAGSDRTVDIVLQPPPPPPTVTKSVSDANPVSGSEITYSVRVAASPSPQFGYGLLDDVPEGLVIVRGPTCVARIGRCETEATGDGDVSGRVFEEPDTLRGFNATFTYTVRVDAAPGAVLTNTACLSLLLVDNPNTTRAFAQPACIAQDSETITVRPVAAPSPTPTPTPQPTPSPTPTPTPQPAPTAGATEIPAQPVPTVAPTETPAQPVPTVAPTEIAATPVIPPGPGEDKDFPGSGPVEGPDSPGSGSVEDKDSPGTGAGENPDSRAIERGETPETSTSSTGGEAPPPAPGTGAPLPGSQPVASAAEDGDSTVSALPSTGSGQHVSGSAITMLIGGMSLVGMIATMALIRSRERR